MPNTDFLMRVADLSLLVYGVLLTGVGLWALQGQLPKAVRVKYARRLIFMSQLPFAYRWRQAVTTEDLSAFEKARLRQLVLEVTLGALSLLICLSAGLNSAALHLKCEMQRLGLQ